MQCVLIQQSSTHQQLSTPCMYQRFYIATANIGIIVIQEDNILTSSSFNIMFLFVFSFKAFKSSD